MYKGNTLIIENDIPEKFAELFGDKLINIINEVLINNGVYNGKHSINIGSVNFMTPENLLLAVRSLKVKNCEGHDKIPQRILTDGIDLLQYPSSILLNKMYSQKNNSTAVVNFKDCSHRLKRQSKSNRKL